MPNEISFESHGDPQAKGRARSFINKNTGRMGHYTPDKTRSYEGMLRFYAQEAMTDKPLFTEAVGMDVIAVFQVPASWSNKKREQALFGSIRPAKKPDLDNIVKAITDACNGVVFTDDALIVEGHFSKFYGPIPMVKVTIRSIT